MNSKGQFVTIFFAVLLITVIIAIFTLEYDNLTSDQNLNLQQSNLASSDAVAYNLLNQYSFLQSLGPSSAADSLVTSSLTSIVKEFTSSYNINFSYGISVSGSHASIASIPSVVIYLANGQDTPTPSPFQQRVAVNSSIYLDYEDSNLQNVQFSYPNGTIIPSWLEGGNIATFNGIDGYANSTFKTEKGPITISFWFYPIGRPSAGTVDLLASAAPHGSSTNGFEIEWAQNGSTVFGIYNGTGNYDTTIIGNITTTYQWYDLVVSYNAINGSFSAYLNGQLWNFSGRLDSGLLATPWSGNSPYNLLIGTGNSGKYFNGSIANIQIYDIELNQNIANKLYTGGAGGAPFEGTLLLSGWWPMAGNLADAINSKYDGTNNNVNFLTPGSASTQTIYWLKTAKIPADSELEVQMGFYPKQESMLNNYNTGEAPGLSPTYAEYDDGNTVFPILYDNFKGTTLNLAIWQTFNNTGSHLVYSIDNGLKLYNGNWSGLLSKTLYNFTVDAYDLAYYLNATGTVNMALGTENHSRFGGGGNPNSLLVGSGASTPAGGALNSLTYYSGWDTATTAYGENINTNELYTVSYAYSGYDFASLRSDSNVMAFIQWFNIRSLPPNDIMPSVLFEGVQ